MISWSRDQGITGIASENNEEVKIKNIKGC